MIARASLYALRALITAVPVITLVVAARAVWADIDAQLHPSPRPIDPADRAQIQRAAEAGTFVRLRRPVVVCWGAAVYAVHETASFPAGIIYTPTRLFVPVVTIEKAKELLSPPELESYEATKKFVAAAHLLISLPVKHDAASGRTVVDGRFPPSLPTWSSIGTDLMNNALLRAELDQQISAATTEPSTLCTETASQLVGGLFPIPDKYGWHIEKDYDFARRGIGEHRGRTHTFQTWKRRQIPDDCNVWSKGVLYPYDAEELGLDSMRVTPAIVIGLLVSIVSCAAVLGLGLFWRQILRDAIDEWWPRVGRVHDDCTNPECVVTLVHGTFGRQSTFLQSNSSLVRQLRGVVKNGVCIRAFLWSGENLQCDREQAATALQSDLLANAKEWSGARQFVVCHSHGGNVALDALRGVADVARVKGLVCFGTPFRHTRTEKLDRATATLLAVGHVAAGFVALVGAMLAVIEWPHARGDLASGFGVTVLLAQFQRSALIGTIHLIVAALLSAGSLWIAIRHRRLGPEVDGAVPVRKLLILSPGDEAGGLLIAGGFLSWIARSAAVVGVSALLCGGRVVRRGIHAVTWWFRATWRLARCAKGTPLVGSALSILILLPNILILLFAVMFVAFNVTEGTPAGRIGAIVTITTGLILLVFCMACAVAFVARALFLIALGPDAAVNALLSETAVAPTPLGQCDVLTVWPSGLVHSSCIESEEAARGVVEWMRTRMAQTT